MKKKTGILLTAILGISIAASPLTGAAPLSDTYQRIANTTGNIVINGVDSFLNNTSTVRIGGNTGTGNGTVTVRPSAPSSQPGTGNNNSSTVVRNANGNVITTTTVTENGPALSQQGVTPNGNGTGSGNGSLSSGPSVQEVNLTEQYFSDYDVYEEGIGGAIFFYTNVSNGGLTDRPVYVDIPNGVNFTLEKDGVEIPYATKQQLGERGSYILRLTVVADHSLPVREQSAYKTTFRFRIQDKTAEAKAAEAAGAGSASGLGSYISSAVGASVPTGGGLSQGTGSTDPYQAITNAMSDAAGNAVRGIMGGSAAPEETTAPADEYFVQMTLPDGSVQEYVYESYDIYLEAVRRGDLSYGLVQESTVETTAAAESTEASESEDKSREAEEGSRVSIQGSAQTVSSGQPKAKEIGYTESYDERLGYYVNTLKNEAMFYTNIPEGMVTNREVSLQLGQNMLLSLMRDGENVEYETGSMISKPGSYVATISMEEEGFRNAYQGEALPSFHFRIVEDKVNNLGLISAPLNSTINNAWYGSNNVGAEIINDRYFQVMGDGVYSIEFMTPAGTQTLNFTFDTLRPYFHLAETSDNNMEIVYETDDPSYAMIYKDGELWVNHSLVNQLDGPGRYEIFVYDAAGNAASQTVEIKYQMNRAGLLVILALIGFIAALSVFVVRMRKNIEVR